MDGNKNTKSDTHVRTSVGEHFRHRDIAILGGHKSPDGVLGRPHLEDGPVRVIERQPEDAIPVYLGLVVRALLHYPLLVEVVFFDSPGVTALAVAVAVIAAAVAAFVDQA